MLSFFSGLNNKKNPIKTRFQLGNLSGGPHAYRHRSDDEDVSLEHSLKTVTLEAPGNC